MNRYNCLQAKAALLLAALLLLSSCGFSGGGEASGEEVLVYCLAKSDQARLAVEGESRAFSGAGSRSDFALRQLFAQPENPSLETAFKGGVALLSFELTDGVAHVNLSREYAELEGIALTLADACVVLTLTEFPEAAYVSITAAGGPHPSREDRMFTRDDFLLGAQGLDPRDVEFELFFAAPSGRYLESEPQSLSIRDNNYALYMVDMLMAGPRSDDLKPVIPEGTKLLTLSVEENTCFVSFSEEFVSAAQGDADSARMTLTALANSLTGLEGIEKVELALNGVPLREYFMYDISGGLRREAAAIDGGQGMDVNFYYAGLGNSLIQVAARVPYGEGEELALAALNGYFKRPAPIGLKKLAPERTSVLNLEINGRTARLDLSMEFAASPMDPLAPYALLKMLADRTGISELELYSEGKRIGEKPYTLEDAPEA